ncbi:hypothetical protein HDF16_000455 [Granulicella aggregans]|uniref:Uncharacterized protein n=1 Tax=Granulicella aggregans TaxID=474949 RepID=A0A7W8E1Y7_9BACT|nr:hypothetical protein [Granulicella aggregans]MBB5055786.1 hypothetical protein [Granulicella aggregans]
MSLIYDGKVAGVAGSVAKLPIRSIAKPIAPQSAKDLLVGALAVATGHQQASDMLQNAALSLVGSTLEIQTELSAAMLRLLFNAQAMQLMQSALKERGGGNITIKLLPAIADKVESEAAKVATPSPALLRLAESAARLNKVSDQLTTQIEQIDAALKRLNLGVATWVTISEIEDEDGNWSREQLGYVRIGSRWGVALRSSSGMRGDPGEPDETFSAFADAPRQLRIRAVEHIPKLLDQLSGEAEAMIAKLSPKVDEISELTLAFQSFNLQAASAPIAKTAPAVKK